MKTKLKSCPFCGEKAVIINRDSFYYDIGCENQGCYLFGGADYYRDLDTITGLWNTRKKTVTEI